MQSDLFGEFFSAVRNPDILTGDNIEVGTLFGDEESDKSIVGISNKEGDTWSDVMAFFVAFDVVLLFIGEAYRESDF